MLNKTDIRAGKCVIHTIDIVSVGGERREREEGRREKREGRRGEQKPPDMLRSRVGSGASDGWKALRFNSPNHFLCVPAVFHVDLCRHLCPQPATA